MCVHIYIYTYILSSLQIYVYTYTNICVYIYVRRLLHSRCVRERDREYVCEHINIYYIVGVCVRETESMCVNT